MARTHTTRYTDSQRRRSDVAKRITISDEYLRMAYIEQRKTMQQIADEVGCTPATILNRLRRAGIETRKPHDYPTTEKQRQAWVRIGKLGKGKSLSLETREAISKARKGKRLKIDYDFGGHEKQRKDGYIAVYVPDHPNANKDGYVMKHHLVMEQHIGGYIPKGCIVHHKNGKRNDNDIENLELMTFREHAGYHMKKRHERERGKEYEF